MRLEGRFPSAEEVVQPKRLLQQIHSQEEVLHGHLDTRVRNLPDVIQQVSFRPTQAVYAFKKISKSKPVV